MARQRPRVVQSHGMLMSCHPSLTKARGQQLGLRDSALGGGGQSFPGQQGAAVQTLPGLLYVRATKHRQ